LIALSAAAFAAAKALAELHAAVKRGADLYLKAAGVGRSPGQLASLRNAFEGLGLPPDLAERMIGYGAGAGTGGRRGQRFGLPEFQGMLGAGRGVMSMEQMTALKNLSEDLYQMWKDTADAARQAGETARALFVENMGMNKVKTEWETLWQQIAANAAPVINLATGAIRYFLHAINEMVEVARKGANVLLNFVATPISKMIATITVPHTRGERATSEAFGAMFPETKDFLKQLFPGKNGNAIRNQIMDFFGFGPEKKFTNQPLGSGGSIPLTSFERMGFISAGGIMGTDYAKQTAENTRGVKELLQAIRDSLHPSQRTLNSGTFSHQAP
jgi:hypothetical protein